MIQVPMTLEQKAIADEALERELRRKQRKFKRRRLTHFNSPKLKAIYDGLQIEHSQVLYEIPFKCYFSFYLFLILKSQVKFMNWLECPEYYRLAISQDLNINKIHRETRVCRNIIKKAFLELVRMGLIEETDYVKPEHKSCRAILVYNDYYIHGYSKEEGRVLFTTEIKFNFYNKPKYN